MGPAAVGRAFCDQIEHFSGQLIDQAIVVVLADFFKFPQLPFFRFVPLVPELDHSAVGEVCILDLNDLSVIGADRVDLGFINLRFHHVLLHKYCGSNSKENKSYK